MYTRRVVGTMHYSTSSTRYVKEPESFTTPVYNMDRNVAPKPNTNSIKVVPQGKEEYEARMKETMEKYTKRMKELAKNKRSITVISGVPRK